MAIWGLQECYSSSSCHRAWFFKFQWATSPLLPHTNPGSLFEFPPLRSLSTQFFMQMEVKCATNELFWASYKLGRSKEWLLWPFLICLEMALKGAVQTRKWQIRRFYMCREIARERFFHVSRYSFLWTTWSICLLWQSHWMEAGRREMQQCNFRCSTKFIDQKGKISSKNSEN